MYSDDLEFVWDRRKSETNLSLRGFDFLFATQIFSGVTVERADDRRDYGEPRLAALNAGSSRRDCRIEKNGCFMKQRHEKSTPSGL